MEIHLKFIGKFDVPLPEPTPEKLGFIEKQNQSSKAGDSTSNLYIIKTAVTVQKVKTSNEPVPSEKSEPMKRLWITC